MSQLRKSSLTPSHISFRTTTYRRRVSAANPCLSRPTILFCDFNFRSSLFRRLHYFSMFGFDSALRNHSNRRTSPMISTLDSGMTD
jgi:hypothetical protein